MVTQVDYIKEIVTMPLNRYKELLDKEEKLRCLEMAGVDNWDWYSDAMEMYDDPSI